MVLYSATVSMASLALFLRFMHVRYPWADNLSDNAYGIYVVHYPFVVWSQYLLLGSSMPATSKALNVFSASLGLSWTTNALLRSIPRVRAALQRDLPPVSVPVLKLGAASTSRNQTSRMDQETGRTSIIMNCAMQIEREQVLKAESHQRTTDRRGYANGFKPKTIRAGVGELHLRIPQTRDYHDDEGRPFYPKSLERGVRSERAMTLAVAEMYIQGVSC